MLHRKTREPCLVAIESLYKLMEVDDDWSVRTERAFAWWAYRLAQHVEAGPLFVGPGGGKTPRIDVWIDTAHNNDVPKDAQKIADVLATVNTMEILSTVVWDRARHTVPDRCTPTVYEDTGRATCD